ncbi:MAG: hemolysin D [Desulfuromonas sp.]|nr:MAG: hemolysin D [Desulfuromonas sp.]
MAQRDAQTIRYSASEERFNRTSHALAGLGFLCGLAWLMLVATRTGEPYRIVGSAVFGACLILFYLTSTIYHSLRSDRWRQLFRKLDHIGIYLLIAGTYTPITLVTLRDGNGWAIFGTVWGLALAGILFKIFLVHQIPFLAPVLYVALGWLIVIDLDGLLTSMPLAGVVWLVAGGVIYTVGLVFYAINRIPHHHGIWHLFVAVGSLCHYLTILWYVIPLSPGFD